MDRRKYEYFANFWHQNSRDMLNIAHKEGMHEIIPSAEQVGEKNRNRNNIA